jgi:hypothetical protein
MRNASQGLALHCIVAPILDRHAVAPVHVSPQPLQIGGQTASVGLGKKVFMLD